MTRTKMIGFSALTACVLGYGASAAVVVLQRMDVLSLQEALWYGVPAATVGEIGLWVAAGSLGWSLFRKRKAFIDRVFRRRPAAV
ncbi:hypothetical protein [Brevundimonas sp. M20]|uniref:hypothetical protein n=1 Tax=Brevundimonas sp. M20 TaxID=2591463 RepID=UPI001146F81A|nr:hypothetical protein [Brevundimonas sp. M20]QDH72171.1 hypothetical protein FKQ52_01295 [Brevundimonas sp. M20]